MCIGGGQGLAIAIERIIYLNFATTNTDKLVSDVESALKSGGVNAAKELCLNTPGPVASIFFQGLDRAGEGVESAEKAVVAYGCLLYTSPSPRDQRGSRKPACA